MIIDVISIDHPIHKVALTLRLRKIIRDIFPLKTNNL